MRVSDMVLNILFDLASYRPRISYLWIYHRTEIHGIWHCIILCFNANIILYFTCFPLKLEFGHIKGTHLTPINTKGIQWVESFASLRKTPLLRN